MADDATIAVLSRVPLFECLDPDQLAGLASVTSQQRFSRNALVILAEDKGDSFFVIRSGKVKVSVTGPDGREIILSLLGPGEFFGELSLLDGNPRSADVTTIERTELLAIRRTDFVRVIEDHPVIPTHLMVTLATRLRKSDRQVAGLALLGISERIIGILLELAEEQVEESEEGIMISNRPTHPVLASMAGTARETVTRVMKHLTDDGYVRTEGRKIIILKQSKNAGVDRDFG
jgi:CRP/FNR family cyclic AMP-dependent transcriptional regulator